jgi:hypothetical protein
VNSNLAISRAEGYSRVARSILAFEKFGAETPETMQFSHKSNINFLHQNYGTSTDLATLKDIAVLIIRSNLAIWVLSSLEIE